MVTLVEQQEKTDLHSDITMRIAVEGGEIEFLKTTSANITPGMTVTRDTGADGHAECTECGDDSPLAYGFVDFDPKQIGDCDDTYAAGDLVPVYPFRKNMGKLFRNIIIADPGSALNADAPLCCEASGQLGKAIEATLADASGDAFNIAVNQVVGINGAAGSTIHNRVYARNYHYLADPNASVRILAYVCGC